MSSLQVHEVSSGRIVLVLPTAENHFQDTELCSEVSGLAFFKIHFLPFFFFKDVEKFFSILIADCVNVLQAGIWFCFLFLGSAGTCLELHLARHHRLQTMFSFSV